MQRLNCEIIDVEYDCSEVTEWTRLPVHIWAYWNLTPAITAQPIVYIQYCCLMVVGVMYSLMQRLPRH